MIPEAFPSRRIELREAPASSVLRGLEISTAGFSKAKRAKDVLKGKSRITIMLDNDVLRAFRSRAEVEGIGYQTLINQTLPQTLGSRPVDEGTLRKVLREELGSR